MVIARYWRKFWQKAGEFTTGFVVTGLHRPSPGKRRAYYFRARDNAGNWGPWNDEMYIETLMPDVIPPGKPGPTTSLDCISTTGNTCFVNHTSFTIQATAAIDNPGGSGIDAYQICRSNDTTSWGGCSVSMTLNGNTSYIVTGGHRPASGNRRAYYFRARDNAGNWGPWNDEMYIQTLPSEIDPPSIVTNIIGTINNQNIGNLIVTVDNPVINLSWDHATHINGIEKYQVVLNHLNGSTWVEDDLVAFPNNTHIIPTNGLIDGGQYRIQIRAKANNLEA